MKAYPIFNLTFTGLFIHEISLGQDELTKQNFVVTTPTHKE